MDHRELIPSTEPARRVESERGADTDHGRVARARSVVFLLDALLVVPEECRARLEVSLVVGPGAGSDAQMELCEVAVAERPRERAGPQESRHLHDRGVDANALERPAVVRVVREECEVVADAEVVSERG